MNPEPEFVLITPEPTHDEREVILKAFTQLWPEDKKVEFSSRWRFSGRWWADQSNPRSTNRGWKN
tara:strand:- start:4826 stop:5020 length:195 start_codon:yes stop_codon:yes gene_type:complete